MIESNEILLKELAEDYSEEQIRNLTAKAIAGESYRTPLKDINAVCKNKANKMEYKDALLLVVKTYFDYVEEKEENILIKN